jgi:signal transduction histidine kinase/tetratricopeptide (TPR) repeat protein
MLANLGIALKKQRKLILIFFLTIFIPALALGIFGIRAIKNERFRQARELENEHRKTAERLKSQVSTELRELGLALQNLAESASFKDRDEKAIADLVRDQIANNPLVETVFYSYENEEPRFPTFNGALSVAASSARSFLAGPVLEVLNRAREQEFSRKDFRRAIALYRNAGRQTKDRAIQAQMLFNEARCLVKLERRAEAIETFNKVEENYPDSMTTSGMPLSLVSRLQTGHCYDAMGDLAGALNIGLTLYGDIIEMRWAISEAQFKTYAGLVEQDIDDILSKKPAVPDLASLTDRYARLKVRRQEKNSEWEIMNSIRQEVIPDLRRKPSVSAALSSIQYSKTMGNRTFLVLASPIIETPQKDPAGLIGLKIKEDVLLNEVLSKAAANDLPSDKSRLVVSDLEGRTLLGSPGLSAERATLTEFFDDNFPPWKMEFYASRAEGIGFAGLKNSFYFWTILTLVVVLTFGAVLIGRTIGHEMEILKLKSDFVSSVSHEFKTPLTSIKALAERLQSDKVIDSARMKQYFSLISQNTDQLTHLVKNLLDFSKIEEGKLEYHYAPTDIAELVNQQIRDFEKNDVQKRAQITTSIPDNIPPINADREALSQALNNLLDNAFKFSAPEAKVEVRVKKEKDDVVIEVADQGIGIPQEEMEKIFDKFYQAKNAVKHSAKGTGLGLTLVKHTVETHGGKVSVRSKVSEGSTFSLIFPIKKE